MMPDFSGIVYLAVFGLACAALLVFIGVPFLCYELVTHLAIGWH